MSVNLWGMYSLFGWAAIAAFAQQIEAALALVLVLRTQVPQDIGP
jgi:hypothetical protein